MNEYKSLSKKLQILINQLAMIDIHIYKHKIDMLLYEVFRIAIEFLCASDDKEIFLKPVRYYIYNKYILHYIYRYI